MDPLAESRKARKKGDSSLALGVLLLLVGLGIAAWGLAAPPFEDRTGGTIFGFVMAGAGAFEIAYGWHYRQRAEKLEERAMSSSPGAVPLPSTGAGYCAKCGKPLVTGAAFCASCGSPVAR